MLHLWIRAEQRANEKRVGITPQDAAKLIYKGVKVLSKKVLIGLFLPKNIIKLM